MTRVEGPRGGEATVVRGPRGTAGRVEGPRGGEATFARRRYGSGGVVGRGPHGGRYYHRLPSGYRHVAFRGHDYYRHGYIWYRPYYYGGSIVYYETLPPAGVYVETLPASYRILFINGKAYYYYEGVYYARSVRNNERVYMVVDRPEGSPVPEESAVPNPLDKLKEMSEYLAGLKQFTLQTSDVLDEVLESGQKIQLTTKRTMEVARPNRVLADVKGDRKNRRVWYDGKAITAFDRSKNLYAVVPMPETIDAALDKLATDYAMSFPLAGLLYADPYQILMANTESGQYVGLHKVGSVKCHHLAFSQEEIDWEIWIEEGARPLPRKVLITYKNFEGTPRYSSTITKWDVSPTFGSAHFEPKPPAGAKQIEFLPVSRGP